MNFRDQWITNENGERTLFTVEMQRQLSQAELPLTLEAWATFKPAAQPAERAPYEPRPRTPPPPQHHDPIPTHEAQEASFADPESIQIDPMSGKYIGRLKWYNATRGYGFIARGGGEDIFFHKTDALTDLEEMPEGQWILYDVEDTERGLEASDVEIYEEPSE